MDGCNLSQEKKKLKQSNKHSKTKETNVQNILSNKVIERPSIHKIISATPNSTVNTDTYYFFKVNFLHYI